MIEDDIASAWRGDANAEDSEASYERAAAIYRELTARRRRFVWGAAAAAAAFLALNVYTVVGVARDEAFELSRAWTLVASNVLPWIGWTIVVRRAARRVVGPEPPGIRDAMAARWRAGREARRRLVVIASAVLATIPVSGVAVWQMQSLGKIEPDAAPRFLAMGGLAYVVVFGCLAWDYWGARRRELAEIGGLLAEYDRIDSES